MADSHIGAFSSIMAWSLAILAQINYPERQDKADGEFYIIWLWSQYIYT